MLFQQTISNLPFKQWLFSDKENKRLLCLAASIIVISFTWLKIVYPYPNFIPPDSYFYLEAAYNNQFINLWATGYSKFLRLVSCFSHSHLVLVVLQYLLLQLSVLYFLLILRYLLSPGLWLYRILFTVIISCPLLPHIANFVSSDCLFTALSLIWFTQLLWIMYRATWPLLLLHTVVLLLAFSVRYNALYYPFISVLVISCTHLPWSIKLKGIGSIAALLFIFIGQTQYEYNKKTGTIQYSAFAGWQLAANALYGYAHAKPTDLAHVPLQFAELHQIVNRHMDSVQHLAKRPDDELGIYYLWDYKSPLIVYLKKQWPKDPKKTYFNQWASVAPLYTQYGRWLIQHHPAPFIKYYIWPNLVKYYFPPAYFMENYNMGRNQVDAIAVTWFGWKSNQLPTRNNNTKIFITSFFPNLVAMINPLFLLSGILFLLSSDFKRSGKMSKRIISCMFLVWVGNTIFSVLAAPIELRYQLFPFLITVAFCLLFVYRVVKSLLTVPVKQQQIVNQLPEPVM